jgi:LysM repeat protein
MLYFHPMKVRFSIVLMLLTAVGYLLTAQDHRVAYIEQYKDIAIQEMERAGVPASIKLAQAILESDFGRSDLARRANNHFGIKCGINWDGREFYKEDDDYDENGKLVKSCFRVYRSPEASFIAHSEFLRDPTKEFRYGFLFRLDPTDYRSWAIGLKRAGYATAANYHERLINLIETFKLNEYDRLGQTPVVDVTLPNQPNTPAFGYNNDVRFVLSANNETVSTIARRADVSLSQLIKYNEQLNDGEQRLAEGTVVYLQPKRNSFRGRAENHLVKEGETMFDISQAYGIKLNKLLSRNRLEKNMEPAPGQNVKLRGGKVKTRPALRGEATPNKPVNGERIELEDTSTPVTPPSATPPPATKPVTVQPERESGIRPVTPAPTPTTPANTQPANNTPPPPPAPIKPEEPQSTPRPTTPVVQPTAPATTPPPAAAPVYHTVEKGDTLWNISQRYQTTVAAIRQLNSMANDNIQLGQRLRVK